jgi:hypothetical protein
MALLKCPDCLHSVSEHADSCPRCGYPIRKNIGSILPTTAECHSCKRTYSFHEDACPYCNQFNWHKFEQDPQSVCSENLPPSIGTWISCPKCRGVSTGGRGCLHIAAIVLLFPVGLLLLLISPTYTCTQCGFRFKP